MKCCRFVVGTSRCTATIWVHVRLVFNVPLQKSCQLDGINWIFPNVKKNATIWSLIRTERKLKSVWFCGVYLPKARLSSSSGSQVHTILLAFLSNGLINVCKLMYCCLNVVRNSFDASLLFSNKMNLGKNNNCNGYMCTNTNQYYWLSETCNQTE